MGLKTLFRMSCLALPLILGGCDDEDISLGRDQQLDAFTQSPAVQADILFIIDNSSSMTSTQEKVKVAFDEFIVGLQEVNSDWHIGVTTTDVSDSGAQGAMIPVTVGGERYPYISADMPNYQNLFRGVIERVGDQGDFYEAGLEAAALALLPQNQGGLQDTLNAGFFREEAKLAVIWISDEDDCSEDGTLPKQNPDECYKQAYADSLVPVAAFVEDYLSLKYRDRDLVLGAIVGTRGSDFCPEGVTVATGDRYIAAVDIVGGITGDICEGDFAGIMEELGVNAAGQSTVFQLSKVPDPETLQVYVTPAGGEIQEIPQGQGWTYLSEPNAVSFYGDAVPPRDSEIQIVYTVVRN